MYCSQCGAPIDDGSAFCPACGARVDMPQQAAAMPAGQTWAQPGAQGAQQGAWGAPQPMPMVPSAPTYERGCFAQAFNDVLRLPGTRKRILQIALIPGLCAIVPVIGWIAAAILSVCAWGYAVEWGRDISRGRDFDMDAKPWRTSLFSLGFFSSALTALMQLVAWLPMLLVLLGMLSSAVGAVTSAVSAYQYGSGYYDTGALVGGAAGFMVLFMLCCLLSTVLSVFMSMFADAAVMHLAVTGNVESAFALKRVWNAVKKQMGKLFCASILPGLVVGGVIGVVALLLVVLLGFMLVVSGSAVVAGVLSLITGALVALAVGFSITLINVLRMRAVGYWAARWAPEWMDERNEEIASA